MKKLIVLLALVCAGCNTYQKQLNKTRNFLADNPAELAKLCADKYTDRDTVFKQGRTDTLTEIITDTLTVNCPDGTVMKKPVPKYINRYLTRTDTIQTDRVETKAKLASLTNDNTQLRQDTVRIKETLRITEKKSRTLNLEVWVWRGLFVAGLIFAAYRLLRR